MYAEVSGNKASNKFLENKTSTEKPKCQVRFIRIPTVFNKGYGKYSSLSSKAKIIYGLYFSRLGLSIAHQKVDKNGEYYFIFADQKLAPMVPTCLRQLKSYKKELVDHHLLKQKKIGKNKADRLYLLKPDAEEQDLYLKKEFQLPKKGMAKNAFPKSKINGVKSPANQGSNLENPKKISKNHSKSPVSSGKAKIASEIDKDNNKTNRYIRYKKKNFKNVKQKNNQKPLTKNITFKPKTLIKEKPKPTIFNTQKINFPSSFCLDNNKKFQFFKIIFQARNQVAKKTGKKIRIENHYQKLNQAISRFQSKVLSGQIQNKKAYLYSTCQNCFTDCLISKTKTIPHYQRIKKIYCKERPDKIGKNKKLKKTSNDKAKEVFLDFKKTINLGK